MKKMLTRSVVCAALTLSPVALAQDEAPAATPMATPVNKPSAEAAKSTVDYYFKGKGQGPILLDAKLCSEVAKEGPNKNECITEVDTAAGVKSGATTTLWLAFLVPQGDSYSDVQMQVKQGSTVRETKDLTLDKEGLRVRQWHGVRLNKPGSWTVTLMRGDQTLKEIQVKVN